MTKTKDFKKAIKKYFEENPIDALAKKQVKKLCKNMEWRKEEEEAGSTITNNNNHHNINKSSSSNNNKNYSLMFYRKLSDDDHEDENLLTLKLTPWLLYENRNTNIKIQINEAAAAPGPSSSFDKNKTDDDVSNNKQQFLVREYLYFSIRASVTIWRGGNDNNNDSNKMTDKKEMMKRRRAEKVSMKLRKDSYIQQIMKSKLTVNEEEEPLLCECRIEKKKSNESNIDKDDDDNDELIDFTKFQTYEERVNVEDAVLEAIKRASFSLLDDNMDMMGCLMALPWLPRSNNKLAERAALKLLEDAMVDACEKEGDADILSDLSIIGSPPPPSSSLQASHHHMVSSNKSNGKKNKKTRHKK